MSTVKLRPEVQWFAEQMERKLRANDHKRGWQDEQQEMHHNTSVPRVCAVCAAEHHLCMACGGDIDMDHRRRKS